MFLRSLPVLLLCFSGYSFAEPLGSSFTYQGELRQSGAEANGAFDFEFQLFDMATGGITIANPVILDDVSVSGGIFSVQLDFDLAPFAGDRLWLQIAVREGSSTGGYTGLLPRQEITPAPYALHSEMVAMDSVGSDEIQDGSILADDVNTTQVQRRVSGCATGWSIRSVADDGSVTCEFDDRVSLGSEFHAEVFNGGSQFAIQNRGRNFCFLTRVSLRDVDAGSEDAWCRVYADTVQSIPVWILEAYSEDDSDARCSMRCINY